MLVCPHDGTIEVAHQDVEASLVDLEFKSLGGLVVNLTIGDRQSLPRLSLAASTVSGLNSACVWCMADMAYARINDEGVDLVANNVECFEKQQDFAVGVDIGVLAGRRVLRDHSCSRRRRRSYGGSIC
jgi:hypothetical protein